MDAAAWSKARDVIGDALELPASERDAFVVSRCQDPALLADIRSVLEHYAEASQFLEQPAALPADANEPDDLEPGTRIGPHVVVERLGRGGMGQVFLANDERLRRQVALKCLLPSRLGAGDERARILREARAAAQISHPNVAAIHDVVEHDSRIFIVMEYVAGENLAARLRHERLPLPAVIAMGRQLASALAAAHATGVVHRDLKPGNIQVTPDGTVKILDFGVAKALVALPSAGALATPPGLPNLPRAQPGTPAYMSPEQLLGRDVDERSDIFSLGIVLFEMVTGRRPFPHPAASARFDQPAERVDEVPRVLGDLIGSLLEIDPLKRPPYAAGIAAALDDIQRTIQPAGRSGTASTVLRAAGIALGTIVTFGILGATTTTAFNLSLQRPERFAEESAWRMVFLGFQSIFGLLVFALGLTALNTAASLVVRVLRVAFRNERLAAGWRGRPAALAAQVGLDDPVVFGQSLAALGIIGLAGVGAWHRAVLLSYLQWASLATPEQLLPLSPDYPRLAFHWSFYLLLVGLALGMRRLLRLRAQHGTRGSGAAVGMVGAVIGIVLLIHVLPYRMMHKNGFEKVDAGGSRCYLIGQQARQAFVFCPEAAPPRSRVVDLERVVRLGVIESIFTPPFASDSSTPR
jgi:hypothetical protein